METFELPQIWERLTDKLSHATSESNMDMYIRQITLLRLEDGSDPDHPHRHRGWSALRYP